MNAIAKMLSISTPTILRWIRQFGMQHTQPPEVACDYGVEDALKETGIAYCPLRKKNSKRQFEPWQVYLQHLYRNELKCQIVSLLNSYQ